MFLDSDHDRTLRAADSYVDQLKSSYTTPLNSPSSKALVDLRKRLRCQDWRNKMSHTVFVSSREQSSQTQPLHTSAAPVTSVPYHTSDNDLSLPTHHGDPPSVGTSNVSPSGGVTRGDTIRARHLLSNGNSLPFDPNSPLDGDRGRRRPSRGTVTALVRQPSADKDDDDEDVYVNNEYNEYALPQPPLPAITQNGDHPFPMTSPGDFGTAEPYLLQHPY